MADSAHTTVGDGLLGLNLPEPAAPRSPAELRSLLAQVFQEHYDFVWRSLRRFGLTSTEADDGAQQTFLILSRRLGEIQSGKERAFLFGTAMKVAVGMKRSAACRRETASDELDLRVGDRGGAEEKLDQTRAYARIDAALSTMDLDLRAVFVLYELEELTMAEVAVTLGIPAGTAASRLRRARELFQKRVRALIAGSK